VLRGWGQHDPAAVDGGKVSQRGSFWTLDDVHLMPRVVQKPHPPIWVTAISTEESFAYTARHGFHLMIVPYASKPGQLQEFVRIYRQLWAESGHRPGAEQVQVAQFCYVAGDGSAARARFERIAKRYLQVFADACMAWQGRSSQQYPGYDKMVASIMATTPANIIANGGAFVGTPDDVAERVHVCIAASGPIEPSMQINFGGVQEAEAFRTLDLFATKVMPRFGS
jgi:alkanesulfonate monooxygenase SsuD/methylene tetrahydromethanopterin reductase-like flavin-dependent oxidoreductase (luciferase family)